MKDDKTKSNEVPADDEISGEELEQVNGGAVDYYLKIELDKACGTKSITGPIITPLR